MNIKKLVNMAKNLGELVDQDNSESTIVNICVHKKEDGTFDPEISIARFTSHLFSCKVDWNMITEDEKQIDSVAVVQRRYSASPRGEMMEANK